MTDGDLGSIIGYTFNNDYTITIDCAKIKTRLHDDYDHYEVILDKNNKILHSDEYQISLPNYLKNFKSPTILTVKTDGTGDYVNLKDVTEFVNAYLIVNSYEIHIYLDIYDVLFDYEPEEINAADI